MGNQINGEQGVINYRGNYPVKINLVKLNTKVSTEGLKFEQSPYNIQQDRFEVKSFMDKTIRDSQFCHVQMPELSQKSLELIQSYFANLRGIDDQYVQVNNIWRMTKYNVQGHFLEHHDRQKLMQGHQHFGTQIFLPPLSQCNFQGGQLKITYNNQVMNIRPLGTLWTHIILPLGIYHQVMKVTSGTRISYVKEIWLKENEQPIETDQDRQIKEAMRPRRFTGRVD